MKSYYEPTLVKGVFLVIVFLLSLHPDLPGSFTMNVILLSLSFRLETEQTVVDLCTHIPLSSKSDETVQNFTGVLVFLRHKIRPQCLFKIVNLLKCLYLRYSLFLTDTNNVYNKYTDIYFDKT